MNVGEWYGAESLSSIMGSVHLVKSNRAVRFFCRKMLWSRHQVHVNQFFDEDRGNTDTRSVGYCGG